MLRVGEVSRQLGLNTQTLYFYERIGLLPNIQRTEAGYRLFSSADIERLRFITRTKALGLSLEEIKDLLALKDGRSLTCREVYQRLQTKVQQLDEHIQQLQNVRDELTPLLERCQRNLANSQECQIFDDLST